ncbi:hypothetical protein PS645_02117 [Pseudomonas fluorescens]|uniref:Uncharacterized protein n=1 Tax=Pseudomonas fluorescens TaxID=294 RepID=A0A5E6SBJ2_PSEFL|nr:hypothetical protein PS645_02117 [Pseudomonas fluorescens]
MALKKKGGINLPLMALNVKRSSSENRHLLLQYKCTETALI